MAIDYAETIRYIQDNLDKVKLSPSELEALQSTLRLIKINVEHQIIEEAVRKSPELKRELEEAKSHVETKIAEIERKIGEKESEFTYPEYTPRDIPETVPEAIVKEVESKNKAAYNKQKDAYLAKKGPEVTAELQRLQKQLEFYKGVSPYIDNPEKFLEYFLKYKFGNGHEQDLQKLIDVCATNMAHGYLEMETSRVSDKPSGVKSPKIWGENPLAYGEPLFTHTKGSSSSGFKINPVGLSQFFELIRDKELVEELTTYDDAFIRIKDKETELRYDRVSLENFKESQKVLQNKDLYTQFEKMITEAADIQEKQAAISEELKQYTLPANPNIFQRFWGFIKSFSNASEDKSAELKNQSRELSQEFRVLREAYKTRLAEDPEFKKLNEVYMYAITNLKPNEGFHKPGLNPDSEFLDLAHGVTNYRKSSAYINGISLHMHVIEKSQLDSKITRLEKDITSNETFIKQAKKEKDELYKKLSPKAKELTDKSPRGAVSMYEIKQRYIDNNSRTRYGVSPFISALILEAIFKMHDIKTLEDADKLGIEFGVFDTERMKDDSIAEAIQAVKNMITPQEERE